MISTQVHSVLDYVLGALFISAPWLFGFADVSTARDLFVWSGFFLIAYSMLTDYEFSAVKLISLGAHMTLDAVLGVTLIIAPMLFGYRDLITTGQYAAHISLGIAAVVLVAFTKVQTRARVPDRLRKLRREVPLSHNGV